MRLDASVDAAVLAVVGGRLVNACVGGHGCAWAATGALATPSGFVYVSCVDIDVSWAAKRQISVLRCLCAAAFAFIRGAIARGRRERCNLILRSMTPPPVVTTW